MYLRLSVVLALFPAAGFGQVAAKVLSIQGRVEVEQSPWAPASVNQVLNAGASIRTGDQSRAVLLLADETQLKINSNSIVHLNAVKQSSNLLARVVQSGTQSDQSILNLSRGQVWLRSKKKPVDLKIATPAVTAAIRGTEFDLKVAEDGESVVSVIEGSIDFSNDQGSVLVGSREQGRARIGQAPSKSVLLNPEDAVQWTLFYSAAVSPRDYPFRHRTREEARAAAAAAAGDPVRAAQTAHDAGELDGALKALDGVSTPEAAETRGWILLEQNRLADALRELERAPESSLRRRLGLSLVHYRLNQFADAYREVANTGGDSRLELQRASLDLIAGDAAAARARLEAVPASDPSYALVQGVLADAYLAQNKKQQALEAARRAVAAAPESPSAHLHLSLVQQSYFDLAAATRSAERALELDPSFVQAKVQYAKLLFGAGDTGKAERVIREVVAAAPEEAAAHSTLGFVLLARGATGDARASFERSLELDNTRGEPHLGLGIVAMRQRLYPDAVTEFLAAASLEPRVSLYQSYLGKAFYEQRKFEQAFSALASAEELDPRDPTPRLYSGIFQNDLNRPGRAVREFEESIRLNDNRAVYRSRFVLDEDRATRNVNLATAYNRLGLSEWANLQAVSSNLVDPTNSSAHLFLAGTFLNLKGRTLAAGSELLLARLLLPVNANSFNAFNDYTTLFDRPRMNWSAEGTGGTFDARGTTLISSGGTQRFAFSSLTRAFRTDGFRPVNDDARDISSVNFLKFALSPHSDLLLGFSHLQTREGDHGARLALVSDDNDPNRRGFLRTNRAEIGYHRQFRPGSDLVVHFAGETLDRLSDDPDAFRRFGIDFNLRRSGRDPHLSLQAAHLAKVARFQFKYGVDFYEGRSRTRDSLTFVFPGDPPEVVDQEYDLVRKPIKFRTAFVQSDVNVTSKLTLTGGLSYDWANAANDFDTEQRSISRWNPQGGFLFSPFRSSTVRFAALRTLQTPFRARLVPSHLNGFVLNQNEDLFTLTNAYNLG